MKSTSQHVFSQAPQANIPRSKFVTSQTYKTAFNSGLLIPFYVDEALPGDTFNARVTSFARLATPIAPFMDNLYMDFQFFAVPIRLVWDNFQRMMGERRNPEDSIDFLAPVMTAPEGGFGENSMMDYMGIPQNVTGLECSSLWCRAYNLIWNEWYRDENLQDRAPVKFDDGPDNPADFVLRRRGKRHDYFTSCLPWPQKGEGVNLPLGGFAPVSGFNGEDYDSLQLSSAPDSIHGASVLFRASGNSPTMNFRTPTAGAGLSEDLPAGTDVSGYSLPSADVLPGGMSLAVERGLWADLGQATAATINSLRQAFQLQRLLERDARGGTRYVELLRSHFGVISPDARLQRPEYLGGGSQAIQIHSVAQTSSTDSTSPQGNLAAYGMTAGQVGFQKSFVEHTLIIGLVSVRADLTYQQGLPRMFSRRSRYDWYWPVLANLGEQAVLNKEIYAQGPSVKDPVTNLPVDDQVFGYQERWAEYRYGISKITGALRSTATLPLDSWHLAQKFTELPKLNDTFIQDNPPLARVLAVQNQPQLIFDSNISISKVRPMPLYSIPGMIDHF